LRWENVEKNGIINIEESATYIPGESQSSAATKTVSGIRKIHLPSFVYELLKMHKDIQSFDIAKLGDRYKNKGYIFSQDNGDMMHIDTISKWFRKFLIINKLPEIPFHGLRHTAASILLDKGINLRALSEILGHAEGSTTINIYSHMLKGTGEHAAKIMQQVLSGNKIDKLKNKM
jgi:integrase